MAQLRVFVSSTVHDLKYLRSSLGAFVEVLGYAAVLSETGRVAYDPGQPLDESCYREVQTCDIYVLIIAGRYGSEVSTTRTGESRTFYDYYDSITRKEYQAAIDKKMPIYILIERSVDAEYYTYRKNRENQDIKY